MSSGGVYSSLPDLLNTNRLLFSLIGANMNITTDQAMVKAFSFTNYVIIQMFGTNSSTSLTTCQGGIYTGAGKTGTALVAAGQVYTTLVTPNNRLVLTLNSTDVQSASPIFSLTTGQGAPATCDIRIYGYALN